MPLINYFPQQEFLENEYLEDESDFKYAEYKRFKLSGKPFDKKYPVRKHEGFFERIGIIPVTQCPSSSEGRKKTPLNATYRSI